MSAVRKIEWNDHITDGGPKGVARDKALGGSQGARATTYPHTGMGVDESKLIVYVACRQCVDNVNHASILAELFRTNCNLQLRVHLNINDVVELPHEFLNWHIIGYLNSNINSKKPQFDS